MTATGQARETRHLQQGDRVAILMHGGTKDIHGKTGKTIVRYSTAETVAVVDAEQAGEDWQALTGISGRIPIVASVAEALAFAPNRLAIGIAPSGGRLPEDWRPELRTALAAGLCVLNGLHTALAADPELASLLSPGQWIWDVRAEPPEAGVARGRARLLSCRRILTVGTDMAVGKMSAAIELYRAAMRRGRRAKFLATGQGGLMIYGDGIALDAVRVDYAAGAVEDMVVRFGTDHDVLVIEGQGSLVNPASTATLPLLRGGQPTDIVLVHRAGQHALTAFPDIAIPPLGEVIRLHEMVACAGGALPPARVAAVALNTAFLSQRSAAKAVAEVRSDTGLPCADIVRDGADELFAAIVATG
ncbi:MAG: DUF1611 domain-containing protein [Candidatus Schekmanbacteria bacterium]|nr:DUF1611 domain-containing protein [Candidatus Schekmanbacteria bacterium]